jgi:hypothetical protein
LKLTQAKSTFVDAKTKGRRPSKYQSQEFDEARLGVYSDVKKLKAEHKSSQFVKGMSSSDITKLMLAKESSTKVRASGMTKKF